MEFMAASDRSGRSRPGKVARFEIQIVPGSVRRAPRSFRFSRTGTRVLGGFLLLYALSLSAGLALAPGAVRDVASRGQYKAAVQTRERLDERLVFLAEHFRVLAAEASELRSRLRKVNLAYGLSVSQSTSSRSSPSIENPAEDARHRAGDEEASLALAGQEDGLFSVTAAIGVLIDQVEIFEAQNEHLVALVPAMSPLRGGTFVLTASMGSRKSQFTDQEEFHAGIDLAAPVGTPIWAPADGRVVYAGQYPLSRRSSWWRQGKMVSVRSGDGFVTLFGHCDEILVWRGQEVKRGDLLATVGDSGWSPHSRLHYAVWRFEKNIFRPVDPRLYILDQRWEDDEELLEAASETLPSNAYDALPRALRGL